MPENEQVNIRTDEENSILLSRQMERYRSLRDKQLLLENESKRLSRELEETKEQAVELFGKSSVDELQADLLAGQKENTRKVDDFEKHLAGIEADLAKITASNASLGTGTELPHKPNFSRSPIVTPSRGFRS